MSTTKISDLPVLSSADAADEFVVVDDSAGVTKKITQAGLADFGSNTLNAAGINFGADTLDDYEEGTWTPNFVDFTGTTSQVNAAYIKMGNFVHLFLQFRFSSTSDSSLVKITGLPFLPRDSGGQEEGRTGGYCTLNQSSSVGIYANFTNFEIGIKKESNNELSYTDIGINNLMAFHVQFLT